MKSSTGYRHQKPRHGFNWTILVISVVLCFNVTLCSGRSSHRLPLAGIFGMGGNKDAEQQQQGRPGPPLNRQQQSTIPPPPPGRGQNPGLSSYGDRGMQSRPQVGRGTIPGPPRLVRQTAGAIPRPQIDEQASSPKVIPPPPPPRPPQMELREENVEEEPVKNSTTAQEVTETVADKPEMTEEVQRDEYVDYSFQGNSYQMGPEMTEEIQPDIQMQRNEYQEGFYQDNSYQMAPPPQQEWYPPPPMDQQGWQQQGSYYDPAFLQAELDQSLAREDNFIMQLDNLTAAVAVMEQREELHLRQLDVLTERIMDIEAQAAEERNKLSEFEANCTAYAMATESLKEDNEEWQRRCSELMERQANDTATITELKRAIKEKQAEAEEIAIAIENVRLAEKRREQNQKRGGPLRKSLFSRIYSFFFGDQEDFEEISREDAYDLAKSTLLRALQAERSSVHELEGVVASLQQNNSAISEMVESRDSIIDELNNRISVFEEDKVVLKAALRQLQKEIKEEAPKAQKLMDDLAAAEKDVERLRSEMNSLIQTHQDELNMLQKTISAKQKTISESESNLTAIGTYVDKLEDRLTSFAVTRRDMEEREKKCKEIEEAAIKTEAEKKELVAKLETYSQEQEELKKLLEELVTERANLQKDNRKLATDSEFRVAEQEQLQSKCSSLECEVKNLTQALEDLRSKSGNFLSDLEVVERENLALKAKVEESAAANAELGGVKSQNKKLEEELKSLRDENQRLAGELTNATQRMQELAAKKNDESPRKEAIIVPPLSTSSERKVPLRSLRKQLAKATGIHGVITPSSTMLKEGPPKQRPPEGKFKVPSFVSARKSPAKGDFPKPEGIPKRLPNRPPPPPVQEKDE